MVSDGYSSQPIFLMLLFFDRIHCLLSKLLYILYEESFSIMVPVFLYFSSTLVSTKGLFSLVNTIGSISVFIAFFEMSIISIEIPY